MAAPLTQSNHTLWAPQDKKDFKKKNKIEEEKESPSTNGEKF